MTLLKHAQGLVARNNKEWADWNKSVSPRVELCITPCLITSKRKGYDDKSLGSRIIMNCKRVLSELFKMTKEEMRIASALLWQMSWPMAVTNIRGKRNSSSFVNPLKRTSTICPSYMRRIECSYMTFLQTRQS